MFGVGVIKEHSPLGFGVNRLQEGSGRHRAMWLWVLLFSVFFQDFDQQLSLPVGLISGTGGLQFCPPGKSPGLFSYDTFL